MKTSQVNAILAALAEVRDAVQQLAPADPGAYRAAVRTITGLPYFVDVTFDPSKVVSEPDPPINLNAAADVAPGAATVDLRDAWMREAFRTVLEVLDDWIEGAWENHGALDHRGETYPCWEQFHPQDIRNMVADAARQLKVELPEPEGSPRETMVGR